MAWGDVYGSQCILSRRLIGWNAISAYTSTRGSLQDVSHLNLIVNSDENGDAFAFQYRLLACAMHEFVIHLPAHAYSRAVVMSDNIFFVRTFSIPLVLTVSLFYNYPRLSSLAKAKYRNNVKYSRQDSVFPSNHRPGIQ